MSAIPLISASHLSKKYCRDLKRSLWYGLSDFAAELAGGGWDRLVLRQDEFLALQDVSFKVCRGECLGLIGSNGAGKSTLLKLLNGLIRPDSGTLRVAGRVGALIELGLGINPVLTGRENILVAGAILGVGRREIARRMDEIIEFAGLADFIDAPVQNYSSGMRVRLGFATAAHLDPDILLIDEVLAVGDAGFRSRCYNRIADLSEHCAIVFVSHNMSHVARLATSCLVLDGGVPVFHGATPEAINVYYSLFQSVAPEGRHGSGEVRAGTLEFVDESGSARNSLTFGVPFSIRLDLRAEHAVADLVVNVVFKTIGDQVAAQCNNYVTPHPIAVGAGERLRVTMDIRQLLLNPGVYRIACLLMSSDMSRHYDWIEYARTLTVTGGRPAGGVLQFAPDWRVEILPDAKGTL